MADAKDDENNLEIAWIRELAGVLDDTRLTEIEIEKENIRVRVARTVTAVSAPVPVAAAEPQPVAAPTPPAAVDAGPAAPPTGAVPSPMVGTVYLSASPGTPSFVKVGDAVREGDTLMIVEAMKTMNPVAAPRSGKVTRILVRNEQPVEFGEPLLTIE